MNGQHIGSTIVVQLITGSSSRRELVFELGKAVPIVAVGARAAWSVAADGVAPVHAVLAFNGKTLLVGAVGGASLHLDGAGIPPRGWAPVSPGTTIALGGARLLVTARASRHVISHDAETVVPDCGDALVTTVDPFVSNRMSAREALTEPPAAPVSRSSFAPPATTRFVEASCTLVPKATPMNLAPELVATRFEPVMLRDPTRTLVMDQRQLAHAVRPRAPMPFAPRAQVHPPLAQHALLQTPPAPPMTSRSSEAISQVGSARRERPGLDPAAIWRAASPAKRATLVLLLPMLIVLLFGLRAHVVKASSRSSQHLPVLPAKDSTVEPSTAKPEASTTVGA
ncbi:MAG TPA: hypothetical protein VM925_37670, partial [Labilithrix sp.]|nr:hypothetical protein [Labilithrix sp.]